MQGNLYVTSILYLCLISKKPNVLNLQLNFFGRFAQIFSPLELFLYKEGDRQGGVVDLKAQ